MKKSTVVLSVALLVSVIWAGTSFAAVENRDLNVELNIQSACTVSLTSGWLQFPTITAATTGTVSDTGAVTLTINCDAGTGWSVTDNRGGVDVGGGVTDFPSTLTHTTVPANTVNYTGHYSPNAGTGTGVDQTVSITAEVAQADYSGKPGGQYQDTVVLTVTY